MARSPKPYAKDGWYCTSIGGVAHQKLCRVDEGLKTAEDKLIVLRARRYEARMTGQVTPTAGPGIASVSVPSPSDGILVHQLLEDFMEYQRAETSAPTFAWYIEKLRPFRERFGNRPVASITYEDGLRYKTWLREEKVWYRFKGKPIKGLGPTTVNQHIRTARTALAWACKPSRRHRYGIQISPFEEIKQLVEKPRERLITKDEFNHLLANCTSGNVSGGAQDTREALLVLRYTTMRPGELRLMKWDYIQLDQDRVVFPPDVIKTRKRREVVLLDEVKDVLIARCKRIEGIIGTKPRGYVFPLPGKDAEGKIVAGIGDRPQNSGHFGDKFRRIVTRCVNKGLIDREKAGERLVPYSTRHTRITELFVEGHDHAVVMFEAGHTNPMTTERYKHLAGSHVAKKIRAGSQGAKRSGLAEVG